MMRAIRHLKHVVDWNLRGKPAPPPHVIKQRAIKVYQKRFGLRTLVETGTYLGQMVEAMKPRFRLIYSIELSDELYRRATELFASEPGIRIIRGDSSEVLPRILAEIKEPCLFWLDGHFSGGITAQGSVDYPILRELEHIGRHEIKTHVILIDDARLFSGAHDAPAKEQITARLRGINPAYTIEEKDDIIRAYVSQP